MSRHRPTISLCMIVKDEEDHLPGCLDSVQGLVDEIIVVDTGSTDGTVEIARSYGARVERFQWVDDFAAARNCSLQFATGDWILWMDADDRLLPGQHGAIRALLAGGRYPVYGCWVRTSQDGLDEQWVLHTRLFRRNLGLRFEGAVHETLQPGLERLGFAHVPPADIHIQHIGYDADPDALKRKNARNLAILHPLYASAATRSEQATYLAYISLAYVGLEEWGAAIDAGRRCLEMSRDLGADPNGWFLNLRYSIWMYLVACHAQLGQVDVAMQTVAAALAELGPARHFCWRAGMSFYRAGYYAEAEHLARRALELESPGAESLFRYLPGAAEALLGYVAMRTGRNREAYLWLGRSLAAPDTPLDAHRVELDRIFVADAVRHGVAAAIPALQTVVRRHPEFTALGEWAGQALGSMRSGAASAIGGADRGWLDLHTAAAHSREVSEHLYLLKHLVEGPLAPVAGGGLLQTAEEDGMSRATMTDLMGSESVEGEELSKLAPAFAAASLMDAALMLVGELAPGCAAGWGYLGLGLALVGDRDDAVRACRQALSLDPGLTTVRRNLEYLERELPSAGGAGYAGSRLRWQTLHLVHQELWERAVPRARALHLLYPDQAEPVKLLALALHHRGAGQEAIELWRSLQNRAK